MTARALMVPFRVVAIVAAFAGSIDSAPAATTAQAPPNAPATVDWDAGQSRLGLRYHDTRILDAAVGAEDATGRSAMRAETSLEQAATVGDRVEQRLKFTLAKAQDGVRLVLRGTVTGSDEARPSN